VQKEQGRYNQSLKNTWAVHWRSANKCVAGVFWMKAKPIFEPRNCESCQASFTPRHRFCSDKCRWSSWGQSNRRVVFKTEQLSETSEELIYNLTQLRQGLNL